MCGAAEVDRGVVAGCVADGAGVVAALAGWFVGDEDADDVAVGRSGEAEV